MDMTVVYYVHDQNPVLRSAVVGNAMQHAVGTLSPIPKTTPKEEQKIARQKERGRTKIQFGGGSRPLPLPLLPAAI